MNQSIAAPAFATPRFRTLLNQCIHCGLCLPACPTYAVFGTEMDAPRGRIAMMRAAAEGRISLDGAFREHIALCLACRACEPACPSGVQYGALVETTRIAIEQARTPNLLERTVRRVALREMLPHARRLWLLARMLRVYQASGLQALVRRADVLPKKLQALEALLPPSAVNSHDYRQPAPAIGERRGTVAFLRGCVQDAFLPNVNAATIRVLQRNGYQVHSPARQTCCGAAQLHVGARALARELARQNIDAFTPTPALSPARQERGEYDAIITNAGGCGTCLKEYPRLLQDDPAYAERAGQFAAKVRDISEFLADHLNVPPRGPVNVRATYADSCHLRNGQRVIRQPRELLTKIPGVELVELKQPDRCCGSAGIYNIVQVETADALLDAKLSDIAATGADTIVSTNTGCQLQLIKGVRRWGLHARVVHLVELLDQSYTAQDGKERSP